MRFLSVILALFFMIPTLAHADESIQTEKPDSYVKIRLLAEKAQVKPGDEIWIGIEQSIYPKWHTYWKNPGDSGSKPNINWDMPDGFTFGDIQWPTPKKIPYGPLLNYGYEDQVILLQHLSIPETIPEGPITLTADIDILVCEIECIPEFGTYSLTLNGPNALAEDNSAYLKTALAKVPVASNWQAAHRQEADEFVLEITLAEDDLLHSAGANTIELLPEDWGVLNNPAIPFVSIANNILQIRQKHGDRALDKLNEFSGVVVFNVDGQTLSKSLKSTLSQNTSANIQIANQESSNQPSLLANITIFQALLYAFLGGLILNLMPCVFPVLSIKALSLCKISDKAPALARRHGYAYTCGVVLSFLAIAGVLIALQSAGAQIGWGFQLQNSIIVSLLAYLLFVIGLNLSGFFEFNLGTGNLGQNLTQGDGVQSSFFTGILATLVATPCTAPFMAGAIGFAFTQTALVNLGIFAALGFGLAFPYLLLSVLPGTQKVLPKPGPWMDVFKQLLAFPMYISAAWLIWVAVRQTGATTALTLGLGLIFIALMIWLFKHSPKNLIARWVIRIIALFLLLMALIFPFGSKKMSTMHEQNLEQSYSFGEVFSQNKLDELLRGDEPIFVEMTADWCITCKANHAVALNVDSTKALFKDLEVRYLIGDWTNQDPEITKFLTSYGRSGVPIYVYYGPPDEDTGLRPEPKLLPQILTPGIVAQAITGS